MLDIHSHILAGMDDGAPDLEMSMKMAQKAVEEGVRTIIATPHHRNEKYENPRRDIVLAVDELNLQLEKENIPLTVLPGQEVRVFGEIVEHYEKNEILTLGNTGKYVLIEFPSSHVPRYTEQLFYDMQMIGLTPVIAHPERNSELIEQPELLYQFIKKGALSQVTAASIAGKLGKNVAKFAMQILESNLAHFLASDAHNVTNRGFYLKEAYAKVKKQYGRDIEYMLQENSVLLSQGKNVMKDIPQRIKKKKVLGLF